MDTVPKPARDRTRKKRGRGQGEGTIYHRVEVRTYKRKDGSIGQSTIDRWQADIERRRQWQAPARAPHRGDARGGRREADDSPA